MSVGVTRTKHFLTVAYSAAERSMNIPEGRERQQPLETLVDLVLHE